jgi:hypothetical protein
MALQKQDQKKIGPDASDMKLLPLEEWDPVFIYLPTPLSIPSPSSSLASSHKKRVDSNINEEM